MAASARSNDPMEREVVLTRIFDAPHELVFAAWAKPEHLQRWWGPGVFTNPICEVDFRVGGRWRIVMRAPNGQDYPCHGVYREIVPSERLVFTNIATDTEGNRLLEGLTTVTFEDQQGKTKLTLRTYAKGLVPMAPQMLAGMDLGWSSSLDSLTEELTGGRAIVISRLFDARREMVWKAWTDPKQIVRWYGPNGFTTTIEEMDVRPGGKWIHVMRGPDGKEYPNRSVFLEVVEPERIVYSHGGGSKGDAEAQFEATWTFTEEGDKTQVTIQSFFVTAEQRDLIAKTYGAVEGGRQTLERLNQLLTASGS